MIFAGYTGSKNPVRNRLKIQFFELDFSKLIFQISSTDQQGDTKLGMRNIQAVGDRPYITTANGLGGWVQKVGIFVDV